MLCYVDIEHEVVLDDAVQRVSHLARRHDHQLRFEQIAGVPCLVQRYHNVSPARLRDWGIQAVIISGNATDWIHYDDAAFSDIYDVIRDAGLPLLGICGGCQLIAMAYGAAVGPIRKLREGETAAPPPAPSGFFKEWGFTPVHVRKPDLLFEGLETDARLPGVTLLGDQGTAGPVSRRLPPHMRPKSR